MTPEEQARRQIDSLLTAAGWTIQNYKALNLGAGRGIALREVPLKTGPCDYLLLVDRVPVGVVEAKKTGTTLSGVEDQSADYAENLPDFLANLLPGTRTIPFLYESTGVETRFRDERDPEPRSRRVFAFHRPETLAAWLAEPHTLRARLRTMPAVHPLVTDRMRACQIEAIKNLEASFAADRPRALIQMATGAGKTYTACAFAYRLIKHAGARRILFLVDRANLGRQARTEFDQFVTPDTGRKFTELYNVQHLASNKLDDVARVTICTVQRLYSMLRGEELDEDMDEKSGFEIAAALGAGLDNDGGPAPVAYNPAVPVEAFDFIVTDECHRSIYNLWRQVLDYFDAHLIGLTATPSKQTIGFFNQNLVMEYNHERAVADGVNVGYEVYRIRTQVTGQGGRVEKGFYVDKRSRETRATRWQRLDEDLVYGAKDLDRSVVVKSQIRTVLTAFRDSLPELFPGRALVPKTLIFCKDDSHAEDVVGLVREVFGRGNDFAKKITYKTYNPETRRYEKSEHLIAEFRTSPTLRIAVTVDMIATGTDIRPLECLVFLRDVRSRTYFEQMKGRGTRVLTPTDLQAVSGADARAKTHFVIVDAVGVCESDKTDSRPLERQRSVAFPALLLGVALGKRDEATLTSLASRLARLDREISRGEAKNLATLAGGKSLSELSAALLKSVDPDEIIGRARPPGAPVDEFLREPTPEQLSAARKELTAAACAPFDLPALRDALAKARQDAEQTIDTTTIDVVTARGFDAAAREKALALVRSFRAYIEEHRAEIGALQILYSRPYKQRLTEEALRELEAKLKQEPRFGPEPVPVLWRAFEQGRARPPAQSGVEGPGAPRSVTRRFTDLVSLVRAAIEPDSPLVPFEDHVHQRYAAWLRAKDGAAIAAASRSSTSSLNAEPEPGSVAFTPDQRAWLDKMRDYVIASGSVDRDHLEADNVLGPIYGAFGEKLWPLMDELNRDLVA